MTEHTCQLCGTVYDVVDKYGFCTGCGAIGVKEEFKEEVLVGKVCDFCGKDLLTLVHIRRLFLNCLTLYEIP